MEPSAARVRAGKNAKGRIELRLCLLSLPGREARGGKAEQHGAVRRSEAARALEQMLGLETRLEQNARQSLSDAGVGRVEPNCGLERRTRPLVLVERALQQAFPLP